MNLKPLIIITVVIIIAGIYGFINHANTSVNLLQSESWVNFPGAQITAGGVHFQPLGRIIVHQDGSAGQPNPPVNLSGQHLQIKGDFKITAELSKIDKQASFRLYANPPIVYDQWRYETPSIDINMDLEKNLVTARIWDGNSSNSMDIRTYKVSLRSTLIISVEHVKNQINIFENSNLLGTMPDHNIFSSNNVWFGTDGAVGSNGWTMVALNAEALGGGSIKIIPVPVLIVNKNANPRKIKFGAAVVLDSLLTDEKYKNLALGEFDMMTPENSMKPEFIHPQPNVYDFAEADLLVDTALQNKMTVHGHALIYDKSTPDWMVKSPNNQRQEIMIAHVKSIAGHFKGRVTEWDVINEPLSNKNALYKNGETGLEPNIWYVAMGENYIDIAFNTARKADPSAKLYLNDYGLENDGQRWDALLSLVKRLQQRSVPINGVGFESHVYGDGDYINSDQLKKHMEILAGLGLLTRISEIDVTGDNAEEQINQYKSVLDACLQESNCTSYTTWGITDLYGSNTRSDRYPLVYGTSLLWDKDMKPKPTYGVLEKMLIKN